MLHSKASFTPPRMRSLPDCAELSRRLHLYDGTAPAGRHIIWPVSLSAADAYLALGVPFAYDDEINTHNAMYVGALYLFSLTNHL